MESFFWLYGLFLAKTLTIILGIILILVVIVGLKGQRQNTSSLNINHLNAEYDDLQDAVQAEFLDKKGYKQWKKEREKSAKNQEKEDLPILFVLDFEGDIEASATEALREHISLILQVAEEGDEVMIRLESGGGLVHAYGFAAAQLHRLRAKNIPLTITVDKIAASGGYMMACLANKIIASPFAIVGSIGVIGSVPNIHNLLKKHDIQYEEHTAGKYKRSLTVFGENTDADRQQFQHELHITHELFKDHIQTYRPQLDIEAVATGETWYGSQALNNQLIDEIGTSDDFILAHLETHRIYQFSLPEEQNTWSQLKERFLGLIGRVNRKQPFKSSIC